MKASVPAVAPLMPPETGASSCANPAAARLLVDLAGVVDGDGRGIDQQGTVLGGRQDLGVAGLDDRAVGQRGDHHVGVGDRLGAAVEHRGALVLCGVLEGGDRIEPVHGVSGRDQVGGHRAAHVAQSQERDRRHRDLSSLRRAGPGRRGPPDHHAHDFVGALQDSVHPQIADDLLQPVLA